MNDMIITHHCLHFYRRICRWFCCAANAEIFLAWCKWGNPFASASLLSAKSFVKIKNRNRHKPVPVLWSEWGDSFAFLPLAEIVERLGQALAGGAHPRRIDFSNLLHQKKKQKEQILFLLFWSEWGDSNSRHLEPKSSALPTGPHPEIYGLF